MLANMSFASGFCLKTGLNIENHIFYRGINIVTGPIFEASYNQKLFNISEKVSANLTGGVDLSITTGKVKYEKETILTDKQREILKNDEVLTNKMNLISFLGFLNQKIEYKINEDFNVLFGLKVGFGIEKPNIYKKPKAYIYANTNLKFDSREDIINYYNGYDPVFDSGTPGTPFEALVHNKDNVYYLYNENKDVPEVYLVKSYNFSENVDAIFIPIYATLGLNYKKLASSIELGGKYKPKNKKGKKMSIGVNIKLGYNF